MSYKARREYERTMMLDNVKIDVSTPHGIILMRKFNAEVNSKEWHDVAAMANSTEFVDGNAANASVSIPGTTVSRGKDRVDIGNDQLDAYQAAGWDIVGPCTVAI